MKYALGLLVLIAVAYVVNADYEDACKSENDPSKDDAACVGANNNMMCDPSSNKCLCRDKYPGANDGKKYGPAPDKKSCVAQ